MSDELGHDIVGPWTEIKLEIIKSYVPIYAKILKSSRGKIKHFSYIDGFAGLGEHISQQSGQKISGSPKIALKTDPPFDHYYFIDLNSGRVQALKDLAEDRTNVTVLEGDCNEHLLNSVFPNCRYEDFRRALCLLDPYDLNPSWRVVEAAGRARSIEILINFMVFDANRNILRRDSENVHQSQIERMNVFWGDESWRDVAYFEEPNLFGVELKKSSTHAIVDAYRDRLKKVAGFEHVPEGLRLSNRQGGVLYYLIFASHKETGAKIIRHIFNKYRTRLRRHGY